MPNRTRIARAVLLALGGCSMSAALHAQGTQTFDRVEVTGSSIKRIEGETALPVQILTREDIQRTGAANVEQLLQTISAAASNQAIPAASASGATTLGISSVSLRGLSSLRTLVLINGKRVTPYGYGFTNDSVSVDVNAIPLAAIDRVEILKDGASAIYGSDAIAGVVNFILRKDYRGVELSAEYGQPRSSAGSVTRVSGAFGLGDLSRDRFNVLATVNYQKERALFGRDRSFAQSSIRPEYLTDGSSGNTFPANVVDAATGGAVVFGNPSYPNCPGPYATLSPLFEAAGVPMCRYDPSPDVTLIPDAERASVYLAGRLRLAESAELYAEASFARNEQNTIIQPAPISDQFAIPPNHPLFNVAPYNGFSTIVLTSASPFYPTAFVQGQTGGATPDLLVRWRAAAVGNRDFTDVSEAPRLNLGVKGLAFGIDYDVGALHSASKVTESVNDGYVLLTQILPLLNSGQVNFFGPNSAAVQAQIDATKYRGDVVKTETSLTGAYAKATRDLVELPAGPLAIAVGTEFREEKYKLTPIPEILIGDLTGYGGNFFPVDRSRNVKAFFAELNVPIVRGLEANAAARYDDYEAVGSKTTPKLSLRWQPVRQMLLRTSYGKGFRAPSLLDLHAPQTTGVTPPGLSDPLRCPTTGSGNDCNTQFTNLNGGNPNLKPEESTNRTIGIVLEPAPSVSVAVDYFRITLEETIANGIPAATILSDLNRFGYLVTRGPVQPGFPNIPGPIILINQTNINQGLSKLAGYDLDARWRIPAGDWGNVTLSLSGTYFDKFDTQNLDGSFTGNVDVANNNTGGLIPRWKHYLSIGWTRGAWSASVAQNWQGDYYDLPGTFEDTSVARFVPRKVDPYKTYDLHASYKGIRNLEISGGIRNVLDEDPPYTNAGGQVYFQAGYDPGYADPRGRFFYARVTYRFL
jgi:iron complex outermembrane receptor protein